MKTSHCHHNPYTKIFVKYPCVKHQTCSQLVSKWAKSDRGRGRDKGHTMHNISSDVSSSDIITTMVIWLNFVQAYQRRWGVPQDEGSLWGGMIGLHQVFDDQMYPPWPNHAKIETPLARALIMMYYLVHDNLSLNLPFLAFILQKQRLFTFLLIVKL